MQCIKSEIEVQQFLDKVHEILEGNGKWSINNQPWSPPKTNKTRVYMAESGVTAADIKKVIQELDITNYSSTKEDVNVNFRNEEVWEFGITKNMVDKDENLYIKMKIREVTGKFLLVMSFHPEMPSEPEKKLSFPYKKDTWN